MATTTILIVAAVLLGPAAVTLLVPPRWLLGWLPVLGAAVVWMMNGLRGVDGPVGFLAYGFVGLFLFVNVLAILQRLLIVATRHRGVS